MTKTTDPISQDLKTQNQVASILLNDAKLRAQIERFMSDPMRCMPSERERLKQMGFGMKETTQENAPCPKNIT